MDNKIIEIFIRNKDRNNQSSCCGGNCNCKCGPTQLLTIDELVEEFSKKYNSVRKIKIYELTSENKEEFISRLNEVLLDSGERLVVGKLNLDFVLSKIAPLISVDGKIISVNNYPGVEQLYNAVMTGEKIPMNKGCC